LFPTSVKLWPKRGQGDIPVNLELLQNLQVKMKESKISLARFGRLGFQPLPFPTTCLKKTICAT